jgi:glycosyltransferase involved in cell wall biosynthesis
LIFSIIIPTFNEEKLLPLLLEQLNEYRTKEKSEFEIIVSDGGSTDKTIGIAQTFADKVLCFEIPDLPTISYGRAKGAGSAEGEILIFLNADVNFENIGKFFELMRENFIYSGYSAMTCRVKVTPDQERTADRIFSYLINNYISFLNWVGLGMARGECQVIRKSVYDSVGGYNTALAAGEDFELFTRIRKKGKVLFVKDLIIYESARRYHQWGYPRILFNWFINSTASWLFKKSVSARWEPVR